MGLVEAQAYNQVRPYVYYLSSAQSLPTDSSHAIQIHFSQLETPTSFSYLKREAFVANHMCYFNQGQLSCCNQSNLSCSRWVRILEGGIYSFQCSRVKSNSSHYTYPCCKFYGFKEHRCCFLPFQRGHPSKFPVDSLHSFMEN